MRHGSIRRTRDNNAVLTAVQDVTDRWPGARVSASVQDREAIALVDHRRGSPAEVPLGSLRPSGASLFGDIEPHRTDRVVAVAITRSWSSFGTKAIAPDGSLRQSAAAAGTVGIPIATLTFAARSMNPTY